MTARIYPAADAELETLLGAALQEGEVRVMRANGQVFLIRAETAVASPLEVEGVDTGLSAEEIVAFIREGRREG